MKHKQLVLTYVLAGSKKDAPPIKVELNTLSECIQKLMDESLGMGVASWNIQQYYGGEQWTTIAVG